MLASGPCFGFTKPNVVHWDSLGSVRRPQFEVGDRHRSLRWENHTRTKRVILHWRHRQEIGPR